MTQTATKADNKIKYSTIIFYLIFIKYVCEREYTEVNLNTLWRDFTAETHALSSRYLPTFQTPKSSSAFLPFNGYLTDRSGTHASCRNPN